MSGKRVFVVKYRREITQILCWGKLFSANLPIFQGTIPHASAQKPKATLRLFSPPSHVLSVICARYVIWSDGRAGERCHLSTLWDLSEAAQNTPPLRAEVGMHVQLYRSAYKYTHIYIFKMGLGKIICCLRVFQRHNIWSEGLLLWRLSRFPCFSDLEPKSLPSTPVGMTTPSCGHALQTNGELKSTCSTASTASRKQPRC